LVATTIIDIVDDRTIEWRGRDRMDNISTLVRYTLSNGGSSRSINIESTYSRSIIIDGSDKYNNNNNKYASTRNDNGKTTTIYMECIYNSMVATTITTSTSGSDNNVANR
jgi:hypothetical protein